MNKLFGSFLRDGLHLLSGAGLFAAALTMLAGRSGQPLVWGLWALAAALLLGVLFRDRIQRHWRRRAITLPATVEQVRRLPIKLHTASGHVADEDVLYPYQIFFAYQYQGQNYRGGSEWIWFRPCFPQGTRIEVQVDPKRPRRSFFSL